MLWWRTCYMLLLWLPVFVLNRPTTTKPVFPFPYVVEYRIRRLLASGSTRDGSLACSTRWLLKSAAVDPRIFPALASCQFCQSRKRRWIPHNSSPLWLVWAIFVVIYFILKLKWLPMAIGIFSSAIEQTIIVVCDQLILSRCWTWRAQKLLPDSLFRCFYWKWIESNGLQNIGLRRHILQQRLLCGKTKSQNLLGLLWV